MITDLQKASFLKRMAAALLDLILLVVLITGIATLLAGTMGYADQVNAITESQKKYETQYGVQFRITQEQFDAMTQEQKDNYNAAFEALVKDETFLYAYNMQINLTLLITTFSILISVLVLEFIVPLLLKNGQTVGKKVFGIAVIRTDGVQAGKLQLFIRALLGKFTVETMIPVYIFIMIYFNTAGALSLGVLAALLIGQIACLVITKTNSALHDLLASTVTVDLSSQMIFRSKEDLMEYTKKIHAERANRSEY